MVGAALIGLGWAGASADMNLMLPAVRRAELGDAEVAIHQGVAVGTFSGLDAAVPFSATALSAGFAPVDRVWLEASGGYLGTFDQGVAIAGLRGTWSLVDRPGLRTGPQLQLGGALETGAAGAPFVAPGWAMWAGTDDVGLDLAAGLGVAATPEGTSVLPLWEVGVVFHPDGGPHRVRLGVAEVLPAVSYRYQAERWFIGAQVASLLFISEAGIEVGARW